MRIVKDHTSWCFGLYYNREYNIKDWTNYDSATHLYYLRSLTKYTGKTISFSFKKSVENFCKCKMSILQAIIMIIMHRCLIFNGLLVGWLVMKKCLKIF